MAAVVTLPPVSCAAALPHDSHGDHGPHHSYRPGPHTRRPAVLLPPAPSRPAGLAGSLAGEGAEHPGRSADTADFGSPAPSPAPAASAARRAQNGQNGQNGAQPQQPQREQAQIPGPLVLPTAQWTRRSAARRGTLPRPPQAAAPRRTMRVLPFGLGLALVGLGMAVIGLGMRRR
jgi:hypothetical protein